MVLNGADGQTRQQMLAALSLGGSELAAINTANAQLIKVIRTPARSITLSVADSLWVDSRRATLRPDYLKQTQAWYGAEMTDLDFSDPSAATRINGWASKETQGKIAKVIERIDPADLALLLNAVYFKGQWAHKFDKAQTQQRDFMLAGGSVKQVPRMVQSGRFDYFETPDMQAIRLSFGEGELVMEVLLPAKSSSLGALEAELTLEHWTGWQAQYAPRSGKIELPRFELKSNYRLNEPLQTLGMTRAFRPDGRAQLTGMFSAAAGHPARGLFHFVGASIDLLEGGRGRLRSRGRYHDRYQGRRDGAPGATVSDDRRPPVFLCDRRPAQRRAALRWGHLRSGTVRGSAARVRVRDLD